LFQYEAVGSRWRGEVSTTALNRVLVAASPGGCGLLSQAANAHNNAKPHSVARQPPGAEPAKPALKSLCNQLLATQAQAQSLITSR
jgi:hypothetical protein